MPRRPPRRSKLHPAKPYISCSDREPSGSMSSRMRSWHPSFEKQKSSTPRLPLSATCPARREALKPVSPRSAPLPSPLFIPVTSAAISPVSARRPVVGDLFLCRPYCKTVSYWIKNRMSAVKHLTYTAASISLRVTGGRRSYGERAQGFRVVDCRVGNCGGCRSFGVFFSLA